VAVVEEALDVLRVVEVALTNLLLAGQAFLEALQGFQGAS
jgi:hypothetical protein